MFFGLLMFINNKRLRLLSPQELPKLGVSKEIIGYYANLVDYYTAYNLRRLENNLGKLYLLCYIFDRFNGKQKFLSQQKLLIFLSTPL